MKSVLFCAVLLPAIASAAPGLQVDLFASSDADRNEVQRYGYTHDFRRDGIERRLGVKFEQAHFSGAGWREREARAYLRYADAGTRWRWHADLGSNGQSWLGSATLHTEGERRQEWFIEREVVETRQGLERDLYATFLGGALDYPLGGRASLTGLIGWQDFSGRNRRLHGRGILNIVLVEHWGLSAQLRTRYFDNSVAAEFDYYSPVWFREALAGLQLRRRLGSGYLLKLNVGFGRQQDAGNAATAARNYALQLETPKRDAWYLKLNLGYSNTPISGSYTYDYRYGRLEAVREL